MRPLLIVLLLLLPSAAQEAAKETTKEAPSQKWPARHQTPKPTLKRLADKDGATIWTTRHFIIVCEIGLPEPLLANLAQTMESVPLLLKKLPLPLWAPPKTEKAVVRLCADETSFVARGGPLYAAGAYQPRSAEILIRGDILLNPPHAHSGRLRLGADGDLLVHELTHLAMHQYVGTLPAWLTEGLAEYFSSHHLGKGGYDFSQSTRLIKQHIHKFYPIEHYPILTLRSLRVLASRSSQGWLETIKHSDPKDAYRPYASSLLLTHYYLAGGTQRRMKLAEYLDQALANRGKKRTAPLLTEHQAVEKKITAFWKPKGIAIQFGNK